MEGNAEGGGFRSADFEVTRTLSGLYTAGYKNGIFAFHPVRIHNNSSQLACEDDGYDNREMPVFGGNTTTSDSSIVDSNADPVEEPISTEEQTFWSTPIFPEYVGDQGNFLSSPTPDSNQLREALRNFSLAIAQVTLECIDRNLRRIVSQSHPRPESLEGTFCAEESYRNMDSHETDLNNLGIESHWNGDETGSCQPDQSEFDLEMIIIPDHTYCIVDKPVTISELKMPILNREYIKHKLIKGVTLMSGTVVRYVRCTFCHMNGPRYAGNGIFQCNSCQMQGSMREMFAKFITIQDITIVDASGYGIRDIICFNEAAVLLLGKKDDEYGFDDDEEAQNDFNKMLRSSVNVRLSYDPLHEKVIGNNIEILNLYESDDSDVSDSESQNDLTLNLEISDDVNFEIEGPPTPTETFPEDQVYELQSKPSGSLLLLNVFKYETGEDQRDGANMDFLKLYRLFKKLNFKIRGNDLNKPLYLSEVSHRIENFKKDLIKNDISSCAVIIMGHGFNNNFLVLSDGENISIDKHIIEPFSTDSFPEFKEKPKIFMFNMCRVFSDHDVPRDNSEIRSPDMLNAYQCYSTTRGHESIRSENGSFFIDRLVKVFRTHARSKHLKELLTRTAYVMNEDSQHYKNEDGEITYLAPCVPHGSIFGNFFFKVEDANYPSELDEVYGREMQKYLQRKEAARLNAIKNNFRFALDS